MGIVIFQNIFPYKSIRLLYILNVYLKKLPKNDKTNIEIYESEKNIIGKKRKVSINFGKADFPENTDLMQEFFWFHFIKNLFERQNKYTKQSLN